MLVSATMRLRSLGFLVLLVAAPGVAFAQDATPPPAEPPPPTPLTPEQQAWVDARIDERLAAQPKPPPAPPAPEPRYKLGFDVFMKGLYQNDQSNGSVWLGNPHPEGDNYSGSNGVAGVLGIRIDGRVNRSISAGARLETRFGQLFADFYENGDLAVDGEGRPSGVNATGESLGMNHAAYAQLRGLYIDWDAPPVPTVTKLRAGSSDLALWNPWTVGKIRFIDRDNAKGFFVLGDVPTLHLDYNAARVALPKLYASAGFNTGISDKLVENPFWARDAVYVGKLHLRAGDAADVTLIAAYLLDEEADLDDPDALGSTNLIDEKDGVVTTIPRYSSWNSTLEFDWRPSDAWHVNVLGGGSRSRPDLGLVFNSIDGNQGLSPVPLKTVNGYALRARIEGHDLGGSGLTLRAEYFNIGADWVATMGARREDDVLLTEGFLDGQLATLNIANEFMDFSEPFYETVIGWHGATLRPLLSLADGALELEAEGTAITYNTNAQDRCPSAGAAPACQATGGQYPDFLFPDGMTDTDFFTFANTNDRGRDPRAAYRSDQNRFTVIGMARAQLSFGGSARHERGDAELRVKLIHDQDQRDTKIEGADDYDGKLYTAVARAGWKFSDAFSMGAGVKLDYWDEAHRSGAVVAGEPRYPDYLTRKAKIWFEARYQFPESASFSYRIELLEKDLDASDDALDFSYRHVVRSIAMLYAGF